jgi:penicillin-binding protein-related factor A (putative recombinase)
MEKNLTKYGFKQFCNGGYICECYSVVQNYDYFKKHCNTALHKKHLDFRRNVLDKNFITDCEVSGYFKCKCSGDEGYIYRGRSFIFSLESHINTDEHKQYMERISRNKFRRRSWFSPKLN